MATNTTDAVSDDLLLNQLRSASNVYKWFMHGARDALTTLGVVIPLTQ